MYVHGLTCTHFHFEFHRLMRVTQKLNLAACFIENIHNYDVIVYLFVYIPS